MNRPEVINVFDSILETQYSNDLEGNTLLMDNFNQTIELIATNSLDKATKPKKMPKKKWFDKQCMNSKRNLNRLACNASKHPFCPEIRAKYHTERNKHTKLIKQKRLEFLSDLNKSIENGHVLNWKKFKHLKQENENKVQLDKYDLLSFFEYFSNLYKKDTASDECLLTSSKKFTDEYKWATGPECDILNADICIEDIEYAIKKLHLNKSTSEDLISNEMIKCLCNPGLEVLSKLFNHCLANGFYPWHTSVITPIYKSGDFYDPDNYRAIAVGSCLGKLFSSILLERLNIFKCNYCKDPIEQLGFNKGAQTNDHILTLSTIIEKYTKKQKTNLTACFVDLRKAFDTVSRDLLLYKIVNLGIRGHFFSVIEDMYTNSTAKIKIDGLLSGKIKIDRGTEQGHPLSPDLFKIFIRDLSDLFYTTGDYPYLGELLVNHLLWADDLVLLALDRESLQNNLNMLNSFCNKWGLSINLKKTKIVNFRPNKHRTTSPDTFYLGVNNIDHVSSYCYLGIMFHENGSFKLALSEQRKKALRALFGMRKSIIKSALSVKSLFTLFDSLVKPVLLYGCQVITPNSPLALYLAKPSTYTSSSETFLKRIALDPYEKFHLRFLKWCLSVHSKASNVGCWGDTGRYPLTLDAIKLSIDYFNRAKNSKQDTLLYATYTEQVNLQLQWYTTNNLLVSSHGLGSARLNSTNTRNNLEKLFKEKWQDVLNTSPKLDFYKTIKTAFCFEKYLLVNKDKHRNALSRLRISAHNLYVERGRYKVPPIKRSDRTCLYCMSQLKLPVVENEIHVISDCPLYNQIRKHVFKAPVHPIPTWNNTYYKFFSDANNTENAKAAKLTYLILETHKVFNDHYTTSQHFHRSSGPCIIL